MKLFKQFFIIVALLYLSQNSVGQAATDSLTDRDFVIRNLALDSACNEAEVELAFGNPIKSRLIGPAGGSMYNKQLIYSGVEVWLSAKTESSQTRIHSIQITNKSYSTFRGIRVGDSLIKVNDSYPNLEQWAPFNRTKKPANGFIMIKDYSISYVSNGNKMISFYFDQSATITKIEYSYWRP